MQVFTPLRPGDQRELWMPVGDYVVRSGREQITYAFRSGAVQVYREARGR
jgi:hypothetical protein